MNAIQLQYSYKMQITASLFSIAFIIQILNIPIVLNCQIHTCYGSTILIKNTFARYVYTKPFFFKTCTNLTNQNISASLEYGCQSLN